MPPIERLGALNGISKPICTLLVVCLDGLKWPYSGGAILWISPAAKATLFCYTVDNFMKYRRLTKFERVYQHIPLAFALFFFWMAPSAQAAQTCVSTKQVDYVYSGTLTTQLDQTNENSTTTCETLIDEAASNTTEYQTMRSNDITDRNSAYLALAACAALFIAAVLLPRKK